jgi:outer membrane receptor protein involved in Fe transport
MSAKGQKQILHGLPPESGHGAAQLNVENIFNKGYWATADGNNNISPGQPRTYRLRVTAKL